MSEESKSTRVMKIATYFILGMIILVGILSFISTGDKSSKSAPASSSQPQF